MDETSGMRPRPSRRRWVFWGLFGTVGLIMGAAYATGFASSTGSTADSATHEATQLYGSPAQANLSQYANMVAFNNPLAITFDGNYGTTPSTLMFTVDLTKPDPYGNTLTGTYYTDIVLTNWNTLGLEPGGTAQWDTLEFKFQAVQCDAGWSGWTPAGTFDPTNPSAQMHVDRVDAHVTFTGLAANHKYCFGLNAADATSEAAVLQTSNGGTVDGTVMFRPNATNGATLPTAPTFTATVNRSA